MDGVQRRRAVVPDASWAALAQARPTAVILAVDAGTLAVGDVSASCLPLWQVPSEVVVGLPLSALVHPDQTAAVVRALLAAPDSSGAAYFLLVTVFGQYVPARASLCALPHSTGSLLVVAIEPAPAAAAAAAAVGTSPELAGGTPTLRDRDELEGGGAGHGDAFRARLDPQCAFMHVAPRCRDVLGYTPFELLRRPLADVVAPAFLPTLQRQLQQAAQFSGETVALIVPFLTKYVPGT
jgi:hypothetical protein